MIDVAFGGVDRPHCKSDIFKHRLIRQELKILKNNTDFTPQIRKLAAAQPPDILFVNDYFAAVGNFFTQNQPCRACLSRTLRADKEYKLALFYLKAHVVNCRNARFAIFFCYVFKLNHQITVPCHKPFFVRTAKEP